MEKHLLDINNSLFLLIDIQSNLAAAMKKDVYAKCERNAGLIIASCDLLGVPIVITEQYSKGLGQTVEPLKKKLQAHYRPIDKLNFSCCREVGFLEKLASLGKTHVVVAGIEAHVCVLQSVLDLIQNGYKVHVISDATCSRFKDDWKNALDFMKEAGAVISTTEIAVFQMLQRAGSAEFKAISPLFKNKEQYWAAQ